MITALFKRKSLDQYCLLWQRSPGRQGSRDSEKLPITLASRLATSIGLTRGLQALSRAKALSQPAFTLVAHPSRRDVFADKL
jgi:hypothetical protein